MDSQHALPLEGFLVVDLSRMLPGAVVDRQLIDLGARLIKVEDPQMGDLMRHAPPLVDGVGVGFAALLRGAESLTLDLRDPADAARLRRLAASADVLIDSFRPGTMERWDLGADQLRASNPGLVICSLSAYGSADRSRGRVGHDLNFVAETGALVLLGGDTVPRLQLADVSSGLLAASAILAGLLERASSGVGVVIEQPLVAGPLPFLTWAWAEAGGEERTTLDTLLAGGCPSYRTYRCGDGAAVAVAALEPKFWLALVELLGLPQLAGAGMATGAEGDEAAEAIASVLATRPRAVWLELAEENGLPVSAVHDPATALEGPALRDAGLLEETPLAQGATLATAGPWLPSLGRTPDRPAPGHGEHTAAILEEFGL
jgi:crotonobetainyl-CoA:carnitine CoA-transferase CaiB-like acyl-CoA transferase